MGPGINHYINVRNARRDSIHCNAGHYVNFQRMGFVMPHVQQWWRLNVHFANSTLPALKRHADMSQAMCVARCLSQSWLEAALLQAALQVAFSIGCEARPRECLDELYSGTFHLGTSHLIPVLDIAYRQLRQGAYALANGTDLSLTPLALLGYT